MKHNIRTCNEYDLQLNCIINKFQVHLALHCSHTEHNQQTTITFACSDRIRQTLDNYCFTEFFFYKDGKVFHCLQDIREDLPLFSCEIDCCLESFITNDISDIIRRTLTNYHQFEEYKAIHLS